MRMWMIPVSLMCLQHRLGEHAEIHKHRHVFVRGYSIAGRLGQIEPAAMKRRHDELAATFQNHRSPYTLPDLSGYDLDGFTVDIEESARDLSARCAKCCALIENHNGLNRKLLVVSSHRKGATMPKQLQNGNGEWYTPGRCIECREGEHEDYTEKVHKVKIIDPDTGKCERRAIMCEDHIEMYAMDGYTIKYL